MDGQAVPPQMQSFPSCQDCPASTAECHVVTCPCLSISSPGEPLSRLLKSWLHPARNKLLLHCFTRKNAWKQIPFQLSFTSMTKHEEKKVKTVNALRQNTCEKAFTRICRLSHFRLIHSILSAHCCSLHSSWWFMHIASHAPLIGANHIGCNDKHGSTFTSPAT